MVRWRLCLILAMLLLIPKTSVKAEDDGEEDESNDEGNDANEEEEEQEDDDEIAEKPEGPGRRAPAIVPSPKGLTITRTPKKVPLECYVCAYKSETPLRSCLDPMKYRVHTVTCRSVDEKCFTSVTSKGKAYDAVVRGCRTACVPSADTKCCDLNRCNNEAFAMPLIPRALTASKSSKTHPTSVVFFVTILLVLQTVVKVAFV